MEGMEVKVYRSPKYNLLQFFERSRDGWKRKCQEGKVRIKRLGSRVDKLKTSRDRWKQRAQSLHSELAKAEQELQRLKQDDG